MTGKLQQNREKIKPKPLPWFRFYTEAIDDPKVQRLPAHLFKTWVNLLCLAGQNGGALPSIDDIAFRLRLSVQDAECHLSDLVLAGLIDITQQGRTPHNWSERQYRSDSSTERVKKHRKIKAETPCNVSETSDETPPEQSQIQNRTESEQKDSPPPPKTQEPARGSRLPVAWTLPDDWRSWARTTFPQSTDQTVSAQADVFRDFWIGKAGKDSRKCDWEATWRNWCRKAFATAPIRPHAQPLPDWKEAKRQKDREFFESVGLVQ